MTVVVSAYEGGESAEAILARNAPSLPRLAGIYARNPAQIEDLAQEMAIALLRALPAFRGECSERTFVFRVAHNVAVSYLVRRAAPVHEPLSDSLLDPAVRADDLLMQASRHARLVEAVRMLPLPLREVITLVLEELSHEEIAGVLDLSLTNVGVRVFRAKERLRAIMEQNE
jgi:RNA polymerase sigma factor (sigma-70 family)